MPYILQGTRGLLRYRNTLGRPCSVHQLAAASRIPLTALTGEGRDRVSFSARYGEREAQAIAALLGVEVSDVTDNADQILI